MKTIRKNCFAKLLKITLLLYIRTEVILSIKSFKKKRQKRTINRPLAVFNLIEKVKEWGFS
ncbi:MAG: hypothetical protein L3J09_03190 [Flavobacteriaceae bacterium]|nr:hypothetical protein [Flavobacteriaceae bacterium]